MAQLLTKGDTLKVSVTDRDATAVTVYVYGSQPHQVAATNMGNGEWVARFDTASWTVGDYVVQSVATDGTDRWTIEKTPLTIEETPNAVAPGTDPRTTAARMVSMIEAMMAGNAGEGVKRYKINNRELERYSVSELIQMLSYWRARLASEVRKSQHRSTLGTRVEVRI